MSSSFYTSLLAIGSVLITTTALLGNCFICYTISRNSKLHTSTFVLIVGQAISDMIYAVSVVTGMFVCNGWFVEQFSYTSCSFSVITFTASFMVSSLTMTTIAIERYILIFYPLKPKLTLRRAWFLNGAIFLLGIFLGYAGQVGFVYPVIFGTVE